MKKYINILLAVLLLNFGNNAFAAPDSNNEEYLRDCQNGTVDSSRLTSCGPFMGYSTPGGPRTETVTVVTPENPGLASANAGFMRGMHGGDVVHGSRATGAQLNIKFVPSNLAQVVSTPIASPEPLLTPPPRKEIILDSVALESCRRETERSIRDREGITETRQEFQRKLKDSELGKIDKNLSYILANSSPLWEPKDAPNIAGVLCGTDQLVALAAQYNNPEVVAAIQNQDAYQLSKNSIQAGLGYLTEMSRNVGSAEVYNNNHDSFEVAKQVGFVFLDLATSFTPGVSTGRDAYEAVTGRDLISGEELNTFARSMAILGAATLGTATIIKGAIHGVERIAQLSRVAQAAHRAELAEHALVDAVRGAENIVDSAGEIIKSAPKHIRSNVKDVDAWKHIGEHLGNKPVTDINPFKGTQDANRIFSQQADGTWKSLRMGEHEMAKPVGRGMHYHLEEWDSAGKLIRPDLSVNVLKTK